MEWHLRNWINIYPYVRWSEPRVWASLSAIWLEISLISGLSTRIKQILSTHFCVAVIIGISFSEPAGFSCRPPVKTIEIWDNWLELAEFYSAVTLSFIKKNKQTGQTSDLRPQTWDLRLQTSDFTPQTWDPRLRDQSIPLLKQFCMLTLTEWLTPI